MRNVISLGLLASLFLPSVADSAEITVSTDAVLRKELAAATAGTTILVAPGNYRGSISARGLHGSADAPIIVKAADPQRKPIFAGGGSAFHLSSVSHLELHDLIVTGAAGNGINIDDGGSAELPSENVVLKGLEVRDIGPAGNCDGIKLSGVVNFHVDGCAIGRWGDAGSGIDMVGCRAGEISNCLLEHSESKGHNGVQTKGGSRDIVIHHCRFENAGQRGVNVGGSTGLAYFRPRPEGFEAKDITVEDCTFIGGATAIAFVGVDGATVQRNTIYRPRRWGLRILQETQHDSFVPCRNGRFTDNIVAYRSDEMTVPVNVGPGTAVETFTFARNAWYCLDNPARRLPRFPVDEQDGVYGIDPGFRNAETGDLRLKPDSPLFATHGPEAPR